MSGVVSTLFIFQIEATSITVVCFIILIFLNSHIDALLNIIKLFRRMPSLKVNLLSMETSVDLTIEALRLFKYSGSPISGTLLQVASL